MITIITESQLRFIVEQNIQNLVESEYHKLLPSAIMRWKAWLNNPKTKNKFQTNHNLSIEQVNDIYIRYFKVLDSIKLFPYNKTTSTVKKDNLSDYGFVWPPRYLDPPTSYWPSIAVNVDVNISATEKLETLIHETQHLLDYIYPWHPKNKLTNAFSQLDDNINHNYINSISKLFKISNEIAQTIYNKWSNEIKKQNGNLYYFCSEREKIANIQSVRYTLKLYPGQNITTDMLYPYVIGRKNNVDIYYILMCWAINGFKDLNVTLNEMNQMATINNKQINYA